jgi:hypothetical protein
MSKSIPKIETREQFIDFIYKEFGKDEKEASAFEAEYAKIDPEAIVNSEYWDKMAASYASLKQVELFFGCKPMRDIPELQSAWDKLHSKS